MSDRWIESEVVTTPAEPPGGSRRRGATLRRTVLVAATVVVVVIGGRIVLHNRAHRHEAPIGAAYEKDIPAAYRAVAERLAPLTASMSVSCEGVLVPVPMLAAPGNAEAGTSPASAALRDFIAHNPWSGTSDVTAGNWLLLSETDDRAVFGQRTGDLGVDRTVVFSRSGSMLRPTNLGGCGTVVPGPQQSAEVLYQPGVHGSTLELTWMAGSNCGSGPARTDRVLDHVVVQQSLTAVRILLISKPAPDAGPADGPCAGVGITLTTRVTLDAPLGSRSLLDESRVPETRVQT